MYVQTTATSQGARYDRFDATCTRTVRVHACGVIVHTALQHAGMWSCFTIDSALRCRMTCICESVHVNPPCMSLAISTIDRRLMNGRASIRHALPTTPFLEATSRIVRVRLKYKIRGLIQSDMNA